MGERWAALDACATAARAEQLRELGRCAELDRFLHRRAFGTGATNAAALAREWAPLGRDEPADSCAKALRCREICALAFDDAAPLVQHLDTLRLAVARRVKKEGRVFFWKRLFRYSLHYEEEESCSEMMCRSLSLSLVWGPSLVFKESSIRGSPDSEKKN